MRSKIVFITFFILLGLFNNLGANNKKIINLPFVKVGNLILVEAEVHGIKGQFVLDTGTPTLWLNSIYFEETAGIVFTDKVASINGKTHQVSILITSLKMHGLKKGVDALIVDLSHIENNKGLKIMGLIGQSIFKNYEVLFDLPNYTIQLVPVDRRGNRLVEVAMVYNNEIPFEMKGHLPIFPVEINGQSLLFGFDSGAECNVINSGFAKKLSANSTWSRTATVSTGWETKQVMAYRIPGLKIDFLDFKPMLTVFSPLQIINDKVPGKDMDGLIGMELLIQQKISVNFRKKVLYIWSDKKENPQVLAVKK